MNLILTGISARGVLLFVVVAMFGVGFSASAADPAPAKLLAGAATSNITPELGIDIVGGFLPFPATHIHDDLHARCLVLDDGKTKLALVVCDLLALHRCVSVEARRLIEDATGIPAANVLISATHTHSAGNAIGAPPRGFYADHGGPSYGVCPREGVELLCDAGAPTKERRRAMRRVVLRRVFSLE